MNHNLIKTKAISVAMTLLGSIIFIPDMVSKPSGSTSMESNANQSTTMSPVMSLSPGLDGGDNNPQGPYAVDPFSSYADVKAKIQTESPIDNNNVNKKKAMSGPLAQIQYTEDISSSGARIYTVPIMLHSNSAFKPDLSLVYNSQAQDGLAGYGWDVAGISAITLSNRSLFYDKHTESVDNYFDAGKFNAYCLDGERLLPYSGPLSPVYTMCTAEGNCLVRKKKIAAGNENAVIQFEVLFPDGRVGIYGLENANPYKDFQCFPIVYLRDLRGREIYYDYDVDQNVYYPSKIRFNYQQNWPARNTYEVVFSYFNYTGNVQSKYVAGKSLKRKRILKSITTDVGDRYVLEHKDRFLTSIRYVSSNGESLNPLTFTYGKGVENSNIKDSLAYAGPTYTYDIPTTFPKKTAYYITGNFIPGDPSEGIVFIPVGNPYGKKPGEVNYGSLYGGVEMEVIPNLNRFKGGKSEKFKIPLGGNFQTAKAIDVDGDGTDEIVVIGYDFPKETSGGNTQIKIKIYKVKQDGSSYYPMKEPIVVPVAPQRSDRNGPVRLHYMVGHFADNYHAYLVTMSYDKKDSRTSIIDLTDGKRVGYHNSPHSLDITDKVNEANYYLTYDIDSDKKTDIFYVTKNDLTRYEVKLSYNGVAELTNIGSISGIRYPRSKHLYFNYSDMNGDGYVDIVVAPKQYNEYTGFDQVSSWSGPITIHYFDGLQFRDSLRVENQHYVADSYILLDDIDKDGGSDIIVRRDASTDYYRSMTGFKREESSTAFGAGNACVPIKSYSSNDTKRLVTFDFLHKTVKYWGYTKDCSQDMKIHKFTDGYGLTKLNTYKSVNDATVYNIDYNRQFLPSEGYYRGHSPLDVIYRSDVILPTGGRSECRYYTYYDASYSNLGLGFLCFGKVRIIDALSDRVIEKVYLPEMLGAIGSETVYVMTNDPNAQQNNYTIDWRLEALSEKTYKYNKYGNTSNYIRFYTELRPQLIKSTSENKKSGFKIVKEYEYGRFDLQTKVVTYKSNNEGTIKETQFFRYVNNFIPSAFDIDINDHTNPRYIIGVKTDISTITEADNNTSSSFIERKEIDYDPFDFYPIRSTTFRGVFSPRGTHAIRNYIPYYNPLQHVLVDFSYVEPTASDLSIYHSDMALGTVQEQNAGVHVTRYFNADLLSFESFRNPGAQDGISISYNRDGTYLTSVTDTLGRVTYYKNLNKYGQPSIIENYREIRTIKRDTWGRIETETSSLGSIISHKYKWDNNGSSLYYLVDSCNNNQVSRTYYDALGRIVRSGYKGADGVWVYIDKEYDISGNLIKESLPHREKASVKWNTYTYDNYDRPLYYYEDGKQKTKWQYDGSSMTKTMDGITVTMRTDAAGNITSVENSSSGCVIYTLRDDGQPLEITTPDNVKIRMYYSLRGERIKTIDPSSGESNDTIEYMTDGSVKITNETILEDNRKGKIITYKDKFGRVVKVERPGEYDTIYSFNENGDLATEHSTNGTGKEYNYVNGIWPLLSIKETVPDGKWLLKSYTYKYGEQLKTVKYSTQNGNITTLSYSYSNGILNKISLPDGTVVNEILEQNDLGLPVKVRTGNIMREYGYEVGGLPKFRKMAGGNLMDVTYEFDIETGNLEYRKDNIHKKEEAFSYENGQLVYINNRRIKYYNNGNIRSISGVGSMTYGDASHPYQITGFDPESSDLISNNEQVITYTCYGRPSRLDEGGRSASFTYNGEGNRVKMYITNGSNMVLTRYYIGEYELDRTASGTKERLYLGGDAYSAPMVYVKENSGKWNLYNIGRDYLGNINIIAKSDGQLVAEYSYDPWGRLRNPETLEIYLPGEEPELFLGRGFAGHEHLTWFGLINMNARLYDPLIGRFLSADPNIYEYAAAPGYNKYSYALNNPLRYVDPNGEFFIDIHLGADGFKFGIDVSIFKFAISGDWEGNFNAYVMIGKEFGKDGGAKLSLGLKVGVEYKRETRSFSLYGSAEATLKTGSLSLSASVKYSSKEKLTYSLGVKGASDGFSLSETFTYNTENKKLSMQSSINVEGSSDTDSPSPGATTTNKASSASKLPNWVSLQKTTTSFSFNKSYKAAKKPKDPVYVNSLSNIAHTTFLNNRVYHVNSITGRRYTVSVL